MIDKTKLDLYEVEEYQFKSFQYQLKGRELTSYKECLDDYDLTVCTDEATGIDVAAMQECYNKSHELTNVRYFIFDFLYDEKLNDPPKFQFITVDDETYLNLIKLASKKAEKTNVNINQEFHNEENLSNSCESAER